MDANFWYNYNYLSRAICDYKHHQELILAFIWHDYRQDYDLFAVKYDESWRSS